MSTSAVANGWTNANVQGYSTDPVSGETDYSEGFGAFDAIAKAGNQFGETHIDIGGGEHDNNKTHVQQHWDVKNFQVYDPYKRSITHNTKVLQMPPFDTASSISVLNVIESKEGRKDHIKLVHDKTKESGTAYFICWAGDNSNKPGQFNGSFQQNAPIKFYFEELSSVFGKQNVSLNEKYNLAVCKRPPSEILGG